MDSKAVSLDQVVLVNEQDEVIGRADKVEAHKQPAQLHRACSVFLFDQDGKLLVQKRSGQKIVGARRWANTACGNVRPGESYEECALRRLREELGIVGAALEKIGKFQYQVEFENGFVEKEIDTIFAQRLSRRPQLELNSAEVQAVDWVDFEQLLKEGGGYAPWVSKILSQPEIRKELKNYAK